MSFWKVDKNDLPTKEQAEVYVILQNMILKQVLAGCSIIAFFTILGFILLGGLKNQTIWALTFLDTAVSYTMYKMFAHYFPAIQNVVKGE